MDSVRDVDVQRISIDSKSYDIDSVATESPLSVNLELRDEIFSVGVLMRTPGDDVDLVIGFLFPSPPGVTPKNKISKDFTQLLVASSIVNHPFR